MGGKVNAGVDVAQYSSVALTSSVGERAHVERTLKSRLHSSCSMASSTTLSGPQDTSSASERMGEERTGSEGSTSAATHDMTSTRYDDEAGLIRDGLQGLSFESGEDTDSAPEGIAASAHEQRTGSQVVENGVLSSPPELSRKSDTNVSVDYIMTPQQHHGHPSRAHALGHAAQYGGSPRMSRALTHEYRPPPALQLPDQTMMDSELAALHQGRESDYVPSNFVLPATLAVSPSCHASCHDVKASLDPNAKEYTPAPSPCISPGVAPSLLQHHIGLPSTYSYESGPPIFVSGVDNRSMMYSPSYGPDSTMSIYGNGSQLAFASGSVAPAAPWGSMEVSDHQVSQSGHLPVTPVGLVQSSHPLRSFGIPPFQSMGLPSVGISGQSVLSHPPISGREHVSRAILLNGVPASMSDEQLKIDMGKWGDVRTVVSDQKNQGLVTVNFYDLRCAKDALRDIQQQHLNKQQRMQQQFQLSQKQRGAPASSREHSDLAYDRPQDSAKHSSDLLPDHNIASSSTAATPGKGLIGGVVMWAQYTLPIGAAAGPDGMNQGTLVVFNLDVDTTMEQLKSVFEAYGDVKELRETPAKKQHKFVEFYDVRDASKALKALDGTEINGKRVKIEFSRPGGQAHKARVQLQQQAAHTTTAFHPISGSRPSLAGSGQGAVAGQPFYLNWSGDAAGSPLTMPGGASYLWASNIGTPVPPLGLAVPQSWGSAGSQVQTGLQTFNYASMQTGPASAAGPLVVMGNMGNMEALSYGRAGSRALALPFTGGAVSPVDNYSSGQGFGRGSGNAVSGPVRGDGASSRRKRNSSVNGAAGGYGKVESGSSLVSGGKLREGPRVGTRISTNKLAAQRADVPPQYVFDEAGVQANDSQRTTLMIKNIPNKYSQQMLLSLLDNHCIEWNKTAEATSEPESAYDFVYLPIDFKNRCNLGYAFVNFTTVQATRRLYRSFHQQQWEEFNSRKVCHVTYARVQGRVALEEHFKNSRFACDTDDYLPLIFRPPRNGQNTSIPATVAAVHQSSRVPGNSSSQDQEQHGKGSRNGERSGNGDELSRRVLANGISATAQELESLELTSGVTQSRGGSSSVGHRSNMPQQQQQQQQQQQHR